MEVSHISIFFLIHPNEIFVTIKPIFIFNKANIEEKNCFTKINHSKIEGFKLFQINILMIFAFVKILKIACFYKFVSLKLQN